MKIITHDNTSHADEFLGCCILLAKQDLDKVELWRVPKDNKFITQEDVDDPNTWILDMNEIFNPSKNCYDHHQMDQSVSVCACTMILDSIYGPRYRDIFPKWKYIETHDHSGPLAAGKLFGCIDGSHFDYVKSPIESAVLNWFSEQSYQVKDVALLSVMKIIGKNIINELDSVKEKFDLINDNHNFINYKGLQILDITCIETSHGLMPTKKWSKVHGHDIDIVMVKDPRNPGCNRMVRTKDHIVSFDGSHPNVKFCHSSGFLVSFLETGDIIREFLDLSLINGNNATLYTDK